MCNKGDIDAVFKLLPSNTQFGPQFSFFPAQGIVIPGGYQAIQVKHLVLLLQKEMIMSTALEAFLFDEISSCHNCLFNKEKGTV